MAKTPVRLTPHADEDMSEFMDRCSDVYDSEECMLMWDEAKSGSAKVVHKTHASDTSGLEFILSDETPDRYGDVIQASGWDTKDFSRNPIALFNHNPNFPVGKWANLRVEQGALKGHLQLAPEGTSARIDEIRKLVDAGILRAVSVGFLPTESKPRDKKNAESGIYFSKSTLLETSLVSIPANPNALAVAKSMNISRDTIDLVFAKNGTKSESIKRDGLTGEHAEKTSLNRKTSSMTPIAQRIKDTQARIVKLRDEYNEHIKTINDDDPDDDAVKTGEALNEQLERQEKLLTSLKAAEQRLGGSTQESQEADDDQAEPEVTKFKNGAQSKLIVSTQRPFAMPSKKIKPVDHIWRSLTVALKHHAAKGQETLVEVLERTYGNQIEGEKTRAVMGAMVSKAAVVPATTTTAGWAADLVQTAMAEFMSALMPVSIYPQLAAKGGSFTFGQNGVISIPTRDSTPTIAGSFVLQGSPIPVRQGSFSAITLTPKKMAVISTMTREITEHSVPSIEGLVREAILQDTAVAIDTVLLDGTAASATRPAGLRNGVSTQSPTGGGAVLAAITGDIGLLVGALLTGSSGNIRSPVWIITPGDALKMSLIPATAGGGEFPFREELSRGTLMGYPVIVSANCTADTLYLIDAADFVTATGDTPRFDVSDQAVLTLEDTTPLPIVDGSSTPAPNTRSLWQTDSIGVRMIVDMNWAMRRTGMVAYTTVLGWN